MMSPTSSSALLRPTKKSSHFLFLAAVSCQTTQKTIPTPGPPSTQPTLRPAWSPRSLSAGETGPLETPVAGGPPPGAATTARQAPPAARALPTPSRTRRLSAPRATVRTTNRGGPTFSRVCRPPMARFPPPLPAAPDLRPGAPGIGIGAQRRPLCGIGIGMGRPGRGCSRDRGDRWPGRRGCRREGWAGRRGRDGRSSCLVRDFSCLCRGVVERFEDGCCSRRDHTYVVCCYAHQAHTPAAACFPCNSFSCLLLALSLAFVKTPARFP